MNASLFAMVILASGAALSAQGTSQPDSWNGLKLDASTPEDAMKSLGTPAKRDTARLMLYPGSEHFREGIATSLPSLTFKKVAGMNQVDLFFERSKLVAIALTPEGKAIDAAALPNIYGVEFEQLKTWLDRPNRGGLLERPSHNAPPTYTLMAFTSSGIVRADVRNALFTNKHPGQWPGSVYRLQLLSRTLDRPSASKGSDLLK